MTDQRRLFVRSTASLAVALLLCAPAAQAGGVAAAGPCAVAPDREPCAAGACAKSISKARNRFSPEEVASDGPLDGRGAPLPAPYAFTGPGTCADPSAGCGPPRTEQVVAGGPSPRAPSPQGAGGPPSAPATPGAPNPPVPPPPSPPTAPAPPPTVVEPPPGPVLPPCVPAP